MVVCVLLLFFLMDDIMMVVDCEGDSCLLECWSGLVVYLELKVCV